MTVKTVWRGTSRTTTHARFQLLTLRLASLMFTMLLPACAQKPIVPFVLPHPVGYVNDFAGVIDEQSEAAIERVVKEVRDKSGGEIVVVTLPSLAGRHSREVAQEIGREWRVGQKEDSGDTQRKTGVVVLVAMRERQWWIETGVGVTTFITGAEVGRVARDYLIPDFSQRQYGRGLLNTVHGIAHLYAQTFGFQLSADVPTLPQRNREQ